jgi:hypothetical protein
MRVLCDHTVDDKYVAALRGADGLTVTTVREALDPRASDPDIATYAEANDWVILSSDDDFFEISGTYGHVHYQQLDDPAVGDVLTFRFGSSFGPLVVLSSHGTAQKYGLHKADRGTDHGHRRTGSTTGGHRFTSKPMALGESRSREWRSDGSCL